MDDGAQTRPTTPAHAYAKTGCRWSSSTLNIDIRYVNGNFRTAINSASYNYTNSTDVTLKNVDASGNSFTAVNTNYGATGWEGQNSWNCLARADDSSQARLNTYSLQSAPVDRLEVVWLHELGHGLGLAHVSSIYRVMYTSASKAYSSGGARPLTSDEVAGSNALYQEGVIMRYAW